MMPQHNIQNRMTGSCPADGKLLTVQEQWDITNRMADLIVHHRRTKGEATRSDIIAEFPEWQIDRFFGTACDFAEMTLNNKVTA